MPELVSIVLSLCLAATFTHSVFSDDGNVNVANGPKDIGETANAFLRRLFEKYGGNNDRMTFEGFEHLLENLGLGKVFIEDHDVHDHHMEDGSFREFHPNHEHNQTTSSKSRTPLEHADDHEEHSGMGHQRDHHRGRHHRHQHHRRRRRHEPHTGNNPSARSNTTELPLSECLTAVEILELYRVIHGLDYISPTDFITFCPSIVYQLDEHICHQDADHIDKSRHCRHHSSRHDDHERVTSNHANWLDAVFNTPLKVWGCSVLAVTIISLVGLVSVAVIPIIGHRVFYNHLLQFLIALAVGTLTGDALLHLLPHALDPHDHDGEKSSAGNGSVSTHHHGHDEEGAMMVVEKGLTVLAGIYGFFFVERILSLYAFWKEKKQTSEDPASQTGSTQSIHDGKCQPIIAADRSPDRQQTEGDNFHAEVQPFCRGASNSVEHNGEDGLADIRHTDPHRHSRHSHHGHHHHHHKVSSVAWMVVAGDGLHNLCDGIAIGASFANSLGAGVGTTIAVFCHELPHELGDFAMELNAGMSAKQAIKYNIISSVLCFIGMLIGLLIGNLRSAASWIFGTTAGIFVYISLVDMIPQITRSDSADRLRTRVDYFALHLVGIAVGVTIMWFIAMYEDDIQWMVL